MRFHTTSAFRTGLATLSLASAALADVQNLSAGTTHPDLQPAIDAAADGDILLVETGTYGPFTITNKSLSIFADVGALATVEGTSRILDLDPKRSVSVVGLTIHGPDGPFDCLDGAPALIVRDCFGAVRIQESDLFGGTGHADFSVGSPCYGTGGTGLVLDHSFNVALVGIKAQGGVGGGGDPFRGSGGWGGVGARADLSAVAAYDSVFRGGDGGDSGFTGGNGGIGYRAEGLGLFAMGSRFRGGAGGNSLDFICTQAGDGGDGLHVIGLGTAARLIDNIYNGGPGGDGLCCCGDGPPGDDTFWTGGPLNELPGEARELSAPRVVADGGSFQVEVEEAEPGDLVWLPASPVKDFLFTVRGVWLIPFPAQMLVQPAASIDGSGLGSFNVHVGSMAPTRPAKVIHFQGYVVDAQNEWALGTGFQVLVRNL